MLQPKRTKFRKMHKGRIKGEAKGGSDLNFGTYGLKALNHKDDRKHRKKPRNIHPDLNHPIERQEKLR